MRTKRLLVREAILGIIHGIWLGLLVAAIAVIWQGNYELALVLGLAMLGNMLIASPSSVFPRRGTFMKLSPRSAGGDAEGRGGSDITSTTALSYLVSRARPPLSLRDISPALRGRSWNRDFCNGLRRRGPARLSREQIGAGPRLRGGPGRLCAHGRWAESRPPAYAADPDGYVLTDDGLRADPRLRGGPEVLLANFPLCQEIPLGLTGTTRVPEQV